MGNDPVERKDLRDYIRPVLKRWWLILAVVPLVTVATYLHYDDEPKTYQASTELYLQPSVTQQLVLGARFNTQSRIENYALLVQTGPVSDRATAILTNEAERERRESEGADDGGGGKESERSQGGGKGEARSQGKAKAKAQGKKQGAGKAQGKSQDEGKGEARGKSQGGGKGEAKGNGQNGELSSGGGSEAPTPPIPTGAIGAEVIEKSSFILITATSDTRGEPPGSPTPTRPPSCECSAGRSTAKRGGRCGSPKSSWPRSATGRRRFASAKRSNRRCRT